MFHVDGRRGKERMDARLLRLSDSFPRFINIRFIRARQPGNHRDLRLRLTDGWSANLNRYPSDSFEVVGRSGWKSGFDDIHAHARQ